MNAKMMDDIANAVLYEGYLLYPYRKSSIKNRQRWNFGVLYPRSYAERQSGADAWNMQTECLVQGRSDATVRVRVRFLHLIEQTSGEAVEREFSMEIGKAQPFEFEPIAGRLETETEWIADDLFKLRVRVYNTAAFDGTTREAALTRSMVSTHTILSVENGQFVSLLEPPDHLRDLASKCENVGTWPVLVGEDGQRDAMLSSPIILYDYPKIAPESPGALFDGTEIDEILTLRIMTLTDQEKAEMSMSGDRAREILERTEAMPAEKSIPKTSSFGSTVAELVSGRMLGSSTRTIERLWVRPVVLSL